MGSHKLKCAKRPNMQSVKGTPHHLYHYTVNLFNKVQN